MLEDVKKREPSYTVGGDVNWHSQYGEQYGCSLKTKNRSTMWSSNPTPGHVSGENYNLKIYMHCNVHSITTYNSQETEAT